jgi:hypothetical protein
MDRYHIYCPDKTYTAQQVTIGRKYAIWAEEEQEI